jgi:hypothetical protein
MRREEEMSRALAAYEAAVARADRLDSVAGGGGISVRGSSDADAPQVVADGGPGIRGAASSPRRGSRPLVPHRDTIQEYSVRELVELVRWIRSDRRLRTHEEIIEEMIDELDFERRGRNIEAAIRRAIQTAGEEN